MKKSILTLFLAIIATAGLYAQQISVVSPEGVTSLYKNLGDAINGADPGSTIYLPGGGFPISDDVKIEKKLTIIGVSHRGDTENVDGATMIQGNLNFVGGASGSAIMGLYVTGNINVGDETNGVEDFLVRYCNVNSIQVLNTQSNGMIVNQSYLRSKNVFKHCNAHLTNNIMYGLDDLDGGLIDHNVILYNSYNSYGIWNVYTTTITNNFLLSGSGGQISNCYISNNCNGRSTWGDSFIQLDEGKSWDDVFIANNGISISSDYRLKEGVDRSKFMGTDGTVIGIEGGSGFNTDALVPVPYIVAKHVDEQTDASGKLNIKIRVKAGQ